LTAAVTLILRDQSSNGQSRLAGDEIIDDFEEREQNLLAPYVEILAWHDVVECLPGELTRTGARFIDRRVELPGRRPKLAGSVANPAEGAKPSHIRNIVMKHDTATG
jgi:hypothetical protein